MILRFRDRYFPLIGIGSEVQHAKKPRQNTGVHTMGILDTLQWASSSSTTATFSVDRSDIQLKKMEMSELQQKICVLFDIHGHAHTILEFKYITDTFYPLLNWYATKLGIKVFEICGRNKLVDEDASVTYEFVEGKWMRDGLQDQHWSLLSWYSMWDLSDLLLIFGAFASCSKNNFTGFGLLNTRVAFKRCSDQICNLKLYKCDCQIFLVYFLEQIQHPTTKPPMGKDAPPAEQHLLYTRMIIAMDARRKSIQLMGCEFRLTAKLFSQAFELLGAELQMEKPPSWGLSIVTAAKP
ncbi:hypothetical protein SELMODRAFT_432463 [Selaginella moellendorffii]|uniref:Uncharacterized protein n=1 Tax=Selaginella moellendorffii TaxID=88036 RepID=D8TG31_SELML|nr:hypothetical protein SELMODRAFT_432463 [Selaginella moellendorffii]